jgi:hypothetical protein
MEELPYIAQGFVEIPTNWVNLGLNVIGGFAVGMLLVYGAKKTLDFGKGLINQISKEK